MPPSLGTVLLGAHTAFSIPVCVTVHSSSFGEEKALSREGLCSLHEAQALALLAKIQKWHWNKMGSAAGSPCGAGEGRHGESGPETYQRSDGLTCRDWPLADTLEVFLQV